VGIPAFGWSNHQLYARYDARLPDGRRVLLNPGVFLHVGNSPNGRDPGHFVGLVQAVGLERRGERTTIPALALVIGRGERESYGVREGPFTTAFGMLSISVTLPPPSIGRGAAVPGAITGIRESGKELLSRRGSRGSRGFSCRCLQSSGWSWFW
jgi:hypothetical protein